MPDNPGFNASRRGFLLSAPLLAATLVRCSNTLWNQTRFADAFVIDPDWTEYRPVLDAVISAILPFERPDFPLRSPDVVRQRLFRMFPLESGERFAGFQRTIALFDQTDLFKIFSGPLMQAEANARDAAHRGVDMNPLAAMIRETDMNSLEAFRREFAVPGTARFRESTLPARRRYLRLWQNSASIVKRQFHGALRSLVMVSTYSMDEMWTSIGYAGPLVSRKGAPS
jgi:hypothetical protein